MLIEKSRSARSFFVNNNKYEVAKQLVLNDNSLPFSITNKPKFTLSDLQDTNFYNLSEDLFT